jgi:hypothetical protein
MNLKNITTADLSAELARRERSLGKLRKKRDRLLKDLAAIDAELAVLGAAIAGSRGTAGGAPKRRRARNDISLGDALAAAMEVRAVVSPSEAAELVKRNGYKTNARNFAMMVSNTLAKDKRFKRISRGQYERVA